MKGIQNFLALVQNNWTTISFFLVVIFGAITKGLRFYKKWKDKNEKEREEALDKILKEKEEALLAVVKEWILKMMCDAELEWANFKAAGGIKRSGVFEKIYTQFPQLADFVDQDRIIQEISKFIEDNMDEMNKVMNEINEVSVKENEEKEE